MLKPYKMEEFRMIGSMLFIARHAITLVHGFCGHFDMAGLGFLLAVGWVMINDHETIDVDR
jgi:hypothetical protein